VPRLDRDLRADAIVIGAGYTGLNAALRLAELRKDAIVLEAEAIGFGASGRNGGQVISGLKYDPRELLQMFGDRRGAAMIDFAGGAADRTFQFIKQYQLDCDAVQDGWLQPATDDQGLATVAARAKGWADLGVKTRVLDREETRKATGTDFYAGGWIDPRGGNLQPLSYVRELARAASARGVAIFAHSAASSLQKANGTWSVSANGHMVSAEKVLLCTNGYTDNLLPGFRRSLIPASSMMCATAPLPSALRQQIMPSGLPISDARRVMNFMRYDAQGRFLIGGRGSFGLKEPESYFWRLRAMAATIFPALEGVAWQDAWGGNFTLTVDHLPHFHNPESGLLMAAGCNGRGIALLSQLGRLMGDVAAGAIEPSAVPVPVSDIKPIPFHALRRPGLEVALAWYRMLDKFGT
jgi:glycine/D-amino acid oxidase-like deaminating enzyme